MFPGPVFTGVTLTNDRIDRADVIDQSRFSGRDDATRYEDQVGAFYEAVQAEIAVNKELGVVGDLQRK